MDKCVTIPANPDLSMVQMKEVPVREVRLAAEERRQSYVEQGKVSANDIPVRVHAKSNPVNQIVQKTEEFEELNDK